MTDIAEAKPLPVAAAYVLSSSDSLTQRSIAHIHEVWRATMGEDAKLLILQEGMTLDVVPPPKAVDILVRLVEASDGGADTYEVKGLVEEARTLLGLPPRFSL